MQDRVKGMIIAAVVIVTFIIVFWGACSSEKDQTSNNAKPPSAVQQSDAKRSQSSNTLQDDSVVPNEHPVAQTNFVAVLSTVADLPKWVASDNSEAEKLAKQKAEREQAKIDAMAALFAINHINWVVTKIKTYNNPAVLEEEYKGLTADALNLRMIKDPELIDTICQILDTIVEMRIEEKERQFLKDELDQGMADALEDSVKGALSGANGLTPLSMAVNAITSAASAAMNYRKAKKSLQKNFEKQSWALDKNRMHYLNNLNKELLRDFWAIVQRYPDLPDQFRISENDVQLLVDHLKDDDKIKRHQFLVALECRFAAFQHYWYHRGATAHEIANDISLPDEVREKAWNDARVSLEKYISVQVGCGNILRRDPMAAKAALLRASVLNHFESSGEGVEAKEYEIIIDVATTNCSVEDWQTRYSCAMLAIMKLRDNKKAEEILAPAISELDWQRRRRLIDWKTEVEDRENNEKVKAIFPSGDPLYECRTLVARFANLSDDDKSNILARICKDQSASVREKMFCYGAMGYKQALEQMRPDLERIRVSIERNEKDKNDHYVVSLPFSWVIARGAVMGLRVDGKDRKEEGERRIDDREDGKQYVLIDYGPIIINWASVKFRSRFDKGANVSYMVEVEFKNDSRGMVPAKAKFGEWVKGDLSKPSGWKGSYPLDVEEIELNTHEPTITHNTTRIITPR